MVFQVTDSVATPLGLNVSNLVFSLKGECQVRKDESGRTIFGIFQVRTGNDYSLPLLYTVPHSVAVPPVLNVDPAEYLYNDYKANYVNTVDL